MLHVLCWRVERERGRAGPETNAIFEQSMCVSSADETEIGFANSQTLGSTMLDSLGFCYDLRMCNAYKEGGGLNHFLKFNTGMIMTLLKFRKPSDCLSLVYVYMDVDYE